MIGNVALVWHADLGRWATWHAARADTVVWTQEMIDPVSEDADPDDRVFFAPIEDEL